MTIPVSIYIIIFIIIYIIVYSERVIRDTDRVMAGALRSLYVCACAHSRIFLLFKCFPPTYECDYIDFV